jgi:hypothetical protein
MRKITPLRILMLFAFVVLMLSAASTASFAQVRITVGFAPPALPVYELPVCPGDGYIWTPGYWAWDPDFDDYYWVPGTWVLAPEAGFFWTPPYWGWDNGVFAFYDGYWGPSVGFYGGIDYGFGYFGLGFVGGRWQGGHFFYNQAVFSANIVHVTNVYNERINEVTVNHVSYNGGPGGIDVHPRPQEIAAEHERHVAAISAQQRNIEAARGNPEFRANNNHGRPPVAATARPGEFTGHDVVAAREAGGTYTPHAPAEAHGAPAAAHPNDARDLPPLERPTAPNTGNAKQDQKYAKQQNKLYAQQQKDRQKLEQQQEKEHQQAARSNASAADRQQMEQRHQQQTQQMQQRHETERQNLQTRMAPPGGGGRPR